MTNDLISGSSHDPLDGHDCNLTLTNVTITGNRRIGIELEGFVANADGSCPFADGFESGTHMPIHGPLRSGNRPRQPG